MADQPIGSSFIPSAANAATGGAQGRAEGALPGVAGTADLAQAYKILSLRLPTVVGSAAPTPLSNLTSPGAAGVQALPSGLNPYAALFMALLKSQLGSAPTASGGGPAAFDTNALPGFGAQAAAPTVAETDPNSLGAGSSLPGAMPPPDSGRVPPKIIFQPQDGQTVDPPAPGWRDWLTTPDTRNAY